MIESLNDQTDLISFNASIEAHVAGQVGKRFKVIAEEIRMLAKEVQLANKNIKEILASIETELFEIIQTNKGNGENINKGMDISFQLEQSFQKIIQHSEKAAHSIYTVDHEVKNQLKIKESTIGEVKEIKVSSETMVKEIETIHETSNLIAKISHKFSQN